MQPKVLKGNQVRTIFEKSYANLSNAEPAPGDANEMRRASSVASPDFNEKREQGANYRNYVCTFVVHNAHSERINCLCYLINGTFLTGSSDKFIRVWSPLDSKPLGNLEDDKPITLMLRLGKT